MLTTKNAARVQGFLLAMLLTACAGAMIVGAGCKVYGEARLDLPYDELSRAPENLARWINSTDKGMTEACTK